MPVTSV